MRRLRAGVARLMGRVRVWMYGRGRHWLCEVSGDLAHTVVWVVEHTLWMTRLCYPD